MNMFIKKENLVKFLDLLKCHTFNTLIGIGDDCSFNSALELLKNEITREEIVSKLLERYDAPKDIISRDVDRILEILKKVGAIDG